MRTLIISDLHLTTQFEERKFRYLENLISKYDRVIINGDFWDGYYITFDQFLNSEWKKLFPLLKDKCIYTFGNHDRKEWQDERVNLFSAEQHDRYKFEVNGVKFRVEHGHTPIPLTSEFMYRHRSIWRVLLFLERVRSFLKRVTARMIGWRIIDLPYLWSFTPPERKIEKVKSRHSNEDGWYVVGHAHIPYINAEERVAISGVILHTLASYIEINEDGEVKLVKEQY